MATEEERRKRSEMMRKQRAAVCYCNGQGMLL